MKDGFTATVPSAPLAPGTALQPTIDMVKKLHHPCYD
jgi:hypothetical protein